MSLDCYQCNTPLSYEEIQHWQPFDFCTQCKLEIALDKENAQSNKATLHAYWQLSRNEQYLLRLLVESGVLA